VTSKAKPAKPRPAPVAPRDLAHLARALRTAPALPPGCPVGLSRAQVAFALNITVKTLDVMLSSGQFPPADFPVSKRLRWKPETLRDWIEERCREHKAATGRTGGG
jgi:predicted DNA-binding transcriptional regulator AlpA